MAWQAGDQYRLVFISSTSVNPRNSEAGDIAYWNAAVQTIANSATTHDLSSVTWKIIGSSAIADNTNAGTGTLGLAKIGTGTITLSGDNTYTGGSNVNGGTLLVNGSTSPTGMVAVNSGGTLGGTGTIGGAVTVNGGGTLSPGASVGALAAGDTA